MNDNETIEEVDVLEEDMGTEIRDTDIVFDCPHCGHNLAIDYRGAGLQIECVNCGESVLVPIPDGMKIDDLDIEPGEILKQLFASRRNLQKAEKHVEELEERLRLSVARCEELQSVCELVRTQTQELRNLLRNGRELQDKTSALLERMSGDIASGINGTAGEDGVDEI